MKDLLVPFRNRNIALLVLGRLISVSGDWVYAIGLMVAIYQYSHGKTFLIGLFFIGRFLPSLILGPFAGALADRLGYRRVMIGADLGRMLLVIVLALLIGPNTWGLIYPIAILVVVGNCLFNPATIGLIPRLVSSGEEQLRANGVLGQAASLGVVLGSAAGGLLSGAGYRQLLLLDAATFLVSAVCLAAIVPRPTEGAGTEELEEEEESEKGGFAATVSMVTSRPVLLFIAAIMAVPEFIGGATPVWVVPYAQQVLHFSASGAGYLYSALAVGGILGGFVTSALGSSIRLDTLLAGSVAAGGLALGLFGVIPIAVAALILLAVVGLAETVEFAAYETLLQQAVPGNMVGRASGTMESFLFDMMLGGNLISGFLVAWLGVQISILSFGLLTILATGAAWWYLRVRTAGQPNALALESVPAFRTVSLDVREWAVRRMQRLDIPAGTVVIRQGDIGDMFYTIARGEADVEVAQDGTVTHSTLRSGDFFGEIALLQDVPRTATVRAETDLILWSLSREDFDELQRRVAEFRESLEETAAARLGQRPNVTIPLATRA